MPDQAPGRVSVIIPARNEEANIARVVRSVASQEGVREILVVDDQSSDGTPAILEGMKRELPMLRVMRVESLPAGWTGKAHALAMGAREAAGDWLLFTDADTEHRPGSLKALLERAERDSADLLSVSPGQRVLTWWEKSVIPLVYAHLARLYRFEDVSNPESAAAAANGQYLLIRREAYERAGGYQALRKALAIGPAAVVAYINPSVHGGGGSGGGGGAGDEGGGGEGGEAAATISDSVPSDREPAEKSAHAPAPKMSVDWDPASPSMPSIKLNRLMLQTIPTTART